MKLFTVNGKLVNKSVTKYLIEWDKKSRSNIQFKVKQFFKTYWNGHLVYEEFPVFGSLLKVDIVNMTRRIAIEVHGGQHEKYNPFFHNGSRAVFLKSLNRDLIKYNWLTKNGFKIIEIYEKEVDGVSRDFIKEKFDIEL